MTKRCSKVVSSWCDQADIREVSVDAVTPSLRKGWMMCRACRDAAGRLGLIDRRDTDRG